MKQTQIETLIEHPALQTFLIDAAGVLYNNISGILPGVPETFNALKKNQKNIFLLTNNSMQHPQHISKKFASQGIKIDPEHIFSSGMGLAWDMSINDQIKGKSIFVVGKLSSYPYIEAAGAHLSASLDEAEGICLMSFSGEYSDDHKQQLADWVKLHPEAPIICCNPDMFVRMGDNVRPVMGQFTQELERLSGKPVTWFGKPHANVFHMTKRILQEKFQLSLDESVAYFDDNPENLLGMSSVYHATLIGVTQTGIFEHFSETDTSAIHYEISTFGVQ